MPETVVSMTQVDPSGTVISSSLPVNSGGRKAIKKKWVHTFALQGDSAMCIPSTVTVASVLASPAELEMVQVYVPASCSVA